MSTSFLVLTLGMIEPPSGCKWFNSKHLYWIHRDLAQRGLNMAKSWHFRHQCGFLWQRLNPWRKLYKCIVLVIFRFTHSHINPYFFWHAGTVCSAFKESVNRIDNKSVFICTSHSSLYLALPVWGTGMSTWLTTLKRHKWMDNNTERH